MKTQTFLDLFSGCGGFTLGMIRSGLRCVAAIDVDPMAIATLRANLVDQHHPGLLPVAHALERDLRNFRPDQLAALIGTDHVDIIVGGPPCQGFSTARQMDGANSGVRFMQDSRRHLYHQFLKYVDYFQPRVFVMENVLGFRSAAGGKYLMRVQHEARILGRAAGRPGYRVHGQVEDAWELGVPQKRRRQLIIGVRADLPGYFVPIMKPAPRARPRTPLSAAIGDLPIVRAGHGQDERDYDLRRRAKYLRRQGKGASNYLFQVLEVKRAKKLTNHVARLQSKRDLRDFARLKEGETSAVAMRDRGVKFEFPYDKSTFKDRYTRQSRSAPCSTIVAHLSKDGLMFIHPTQNRSLTPREAARIQSFPDWFRFPTSRTRAFRLIGNAVPPLVGEAVGHAVNSALERIRLNSTNIKLDLAPLPKDEKEAVKWLLPLLDLESRALRGIRDETFKRAWYSIAFLFAGLHPDSALDHGERRAYDVKNHMSLNRIEPRLVKPYYKQSGWPVILARLAKEAWRRYESGALKDHEFYCSDAQLSGMRYRGIGQSIKRTGKVAARDRNGGFRLSLRQEPRNHRAG